MSYFGCGRSVVGAGRAEVGRLLTESVGEVERGGMEKRW